MEDRGQEFALPLHSLMKKGRLDLFKRKISDMEDITQKDVQGRTVLFCAAEENKPEYVKALLDSGYAESLDEDHQDDKGRTPLHIACLKCPKAVAGLVDKGSKVTLADKTGNKELPLHYAARGDNEEAIAVLLDKKAPVDDKNKQKQTALMIALRENSLDAIDILAKRGADVYAKDGKGKEVWELAEDLADTKARDALHKALDIQDEREFEIRKRYGSKKKIEVRSNRTNDFLIHFSFLV